MIITLSPQQQNLLLLTGWLYLQYGHPERSRTLLTALLQLYPQHYMARRILLVTLLKLERGEEALAQIELLMMGEGICGPLWLCRSRACQLAGKYAEARLAYQQYLEQEEQNESTPA